MKKNGPPLRREFDMLTTLQKEAQAIPIPQRLGLLHWLRHWWIRPHRVFWEIDPATGEWRRI